MQAKIYLDPWLHQRQSVVIQPNPKVVLHPPQFRDNFGRPSLLTPILSRPDAVWVDRFLTLLAGATPPARIRSAVRALRVSLSRYFPS
jgi:hypothetical protein